VKVRAEGLSFGYPGHLGRPGVRVLSDASLELADGRITVVIGPSGSGKSTLLQLLAGLLHPDAGSIWFDEQDITGVPTERRDVGVVFQSYALFPHLSVRENIAFGLRTARRRFSLRLSSQPPRRRIDSRVWDAAALVGIESLLDRRPSELSGGEQQRVALARAIAPRPALLLLDEPLSALDARLRRSVRLELSALLRRLGTTALYVTHDQEEAMLLADHLIVLDGGRVVQAGPPLDLYRRPATPFVASFLGEANLLEATLHGREDGDGSPGSLETALGRLPLRRASTGNGPAGNGRILVRPEDLEIGGSGATATVVESRGLGPYDLVVLRLEEGTELVVHLPPETAPPIGTRVRAGLRHKHPHYLPDER
jgi:ABC-type Fe3+/spermidine/putrescine transport system ATPase subunit